MITALFAPFAFCNPASLSLFLKWWIKDESEQEIAPQTLKSTKLFALQ